MEEVQGGGGKTVEGLARFQGSGRSRQEAERKERIASSNISFVPVPLGTLDFSIYPNLASSILSDPFFGSMDLSNGDNLRTVRPWEFDGEASTHELPTGYNTIW